MGLGDRDFILGIWDWQGIGMDGGQQDSLAMEMAPRVMGISYIGSHFLSYLPFFYGGAIAIRTQKKGWG